MAKTKRTKRARLMRVYHTTRATNAANILRAGFQDGKGRYLTSRTWRGAWVADRPTWDGGETSGTLSRTIGSCCS